MKCPFCAEEIKDEAVLCRFCHSRVVDGTWQPPAAPKAARKGRFTMVTSGWLLTISAAWSLLQLTSPVLLFGAVRGGVTAVVYNLVFAASFALMGVALIQRRPWALRATWFASACYSFDKLVFLLDTNGRRAMIARGAELAGSLMPGSEVLVEQMMVLVSLLFLLGWWGFVAYVWFHRADFKDDATP